MKQLNRKPLARRRVRMRTALLLTLWAFVMAVAARGVLALPVFSRMPAGLHLLLETLLTAVGFGGAAYAGLLWLDGMHTELIPRRILGTSQIMWYALVGVLAVAPVSLCQDVMLALFGARASAAGAMDPALFVLMLLKSALLVPVLEELFFRGYLQSALGRYGRKQAAAAAALVFALMHGDLLILPHAAFGLLMGLIVLRTDSILASMLVHGCYNAVILIAAYTGVDVLFAGLSFVSCALRVGMTLAFVYALGRAVTAREVRLKFEIPTDAAALWQGMTKRERLLVIGACCAVLIAAMLTGVLV